MEDLKVTSGQLEAVLKNRGLELHTDRRTVLTGEEENADILRSYKAGESAVQIAARYGVEESTIRRRLEAAGVERRGRGRTVPEAEAKSLVMEAWAERKSLSYVTSKARISKDRTRRLLLEGGVAEEDLPRVDLTMPLHTLTEEEAREAVRLYKAGEANVSMLAGRFNVGFAVIRQALEVAGVEPAAIPVVRRAPRSDEEVVSAVVAAWKERPTLRHVYRRAGVSGRRAERLLRAEGLLSED